MVKYSKTIFSIVNQYNIPVYDAKLFIINNSKLYCNYTDPSGITNFNLQTGRYRLIVEKEGYICRKFNIKVFKNMEFTRVKLNCISNSKISGNINDSLSKPIFNATVMLYYLTDDNDLIPINHTKTIKTGVYSFINIPNGNYIIKALK